MNNYEYSPITDNFLEEIHKINQDNVPEVGSRSLKGLKNSNQNDLIIISDLDEIPNPKAIKNFNIKMRYAVLKQRHFYYK